MKWLRGVKYRVFKKYKCFINNDGVYYTPDEYRKMINKASEAKVGDLIYNPYKDIKEKIKEIKREWEPSYSFARAFHNVGILHIYFVTESGYIIYDINEEELCGKAREEYNKED